MNVTRLFGFMKGRQTPVIDKDQKNYMKLLNANSYEKGSWFLHMLRMKIGDDLFWKSIRAYYDTYKYNNALTSDFKRIVEGVVHMKILPYFLINGFTELANRRLISSGRIKRIKLKLVLVRSKKPRLFLNSHWNC